MMKFTLRVSLFAACFASTNAGDVLSLTPDNFDDITAGKTVFIKFFAPWCGHCKKMAPDWQKLAEEWKDDKIGLIAEVDCTAEGRPLCDANGVRGFPTLKYGDPANLEDYQGGRSFNELKAFAKENLVPICSVSNTDLCDDEKKAQIEKYSSMSQSDLEKAIQDEEKKLEDAENAFHDAVAQLQTEYQKISEKKDEVIAAVREAGLGLMKSVLVSKSKKEAKDGTKDEL